MKNICVKCQRTVPMLLQYYSIYWSQCRSCNIFFVEEGLTKKDCLKTVWDRMFQIEVKYRFDNNRLKLYNDYRIFMKAIYSGKLYDYLDFEERVYNIIRSIT